jgi:hypothetical protein
VKVEVNPRLKLLLENDYKTLDCFKRENARRAAEAQKSASLKSHQGSAPSVPASSPGAAVHAATNGPAAAAQVPAAAS